MFISKQRKKGKNAVCGKWEIYETVLHYIPFGNKWELGLGCKLDISHSKGTEKLKNE